MKIKNWFLDINENRESVRRHARVKALNLIRMGGDHDLPDHVVLNISDLSQCGMGFRTTFKLDRDQEYSVVLHTPEKDIEAALKVRWCEWVGGADRAFEVGAEIVSLSRENSQFLLGLIKASIPQT